MWLLRPFTSSHHRHPLQQPQFLVSKSVASKNKQQGEKRIREATHIKIILFA
jgi:hypothetical protein